jgi:O-antigen/teichoic acid export membrane protein
MRNPLAGSLAKNVGWMFLGRGLNFIVQAAYFILLARLLGAAPYGTFVGAVAAVSLLSQYSALGSGMILIREVSRDKKRFQQYWGNVIVTSITVGLLCVTVFASFGKWMVGPASASIIVLVAIGECTCARIAEGAGQAFQAFEQLKLTAALTSITNISRLGAATGMLVILHHSNVRQWAVASLVVSCFSMAVSLIMVSTRLGQPKLDIALFKKHFFEGIGFSIAASSCSAYNDIDKAMLSRYGMLAAGGIYSMAYRVVDIGFAPIASVHLAAFPRFCQLGIGGARGSIALARKMLNKTVVISLVIAAAMYLAAPLIPYVLGKSFASSVSALRWLCILPAFRNLHMTSGDVLTGAGYQKYRTATQIIAALFNFGINLWLIPAYSWHGAAWSSLATDGLLAGLNLLILAWLLRNENRQHIANQVIA